MAAGSTAQLGAADCYWKFADFVTVTIVASNCYLVALIKLLSRMQLVSCLIMRLFRLAHHPRRAGGHRLSAVADERLSILL